MTRKLSAAQLDLFRQVEALTPHQLLIRQLLAGSAKFTLVSKRTGDRFTYWFRTGALDRTKNWTVNNQDRRFFFVKLLWGPNNQSDYRLIGTLRRADEESNVISFAPWRNAADKPPAPSLAGIAWFVQQVFIVGHIPESVEINMAASCLRCGRELTVPESIKSGFGPECIGHV